MPILFPTVRGNEQRPLAGSSIDWAHGTASALVCAVVAGSDYGIQDLVKPGTSPTGTARWSFADAGANTTNPTAGPASLGTRGHMKGGRVISLNSTASTSGPSLGPRNDLSMSVSNAGGWSILVRVTTPASFSTGDFIWLLSKANGQTTANANMSWAIAWKATSSTALSPVWMLGTGGSVLQTSPSTGNFSAGASDKQWFDIVVTQESASPFNTRWYINGISVGTSTAIATNPLSSTNNVYIGEHNGALTRSFYFSHAYVWKRILRAGEIHALTQSPFAFIQSGTKWTVGSIPPISTTDAAGGTESPARDPLAFVRSSSDAGAGVDVATRIFSATTTDSVSTADSATRIYIQPKTTTDTASAVDSGTSLLAGKGTTDAAGGTDAARGIIPYYSWRPIMKPDNSEILVMQNRYVDGKDLTKAQIVSVNPDQYSQTTVIDTPASNGLVSYGFPEWHPDGSKIVLTLETSTEYQIVNYETAFWGLSSTIQTATKPSQLLDPSYSPDGTLIAYVKLSGGTYSIRVMNTGGTDVYTLYSSSNVLRGPRYSPDQTMIAFCEESTPPDITFPYGIYTLMYLPATGGTVTTVIDDGTVNQFPCWPNDSQLIFQKFTYGDSNFVLMRTNIDGSGQTLLADGEYPQAVSA